jgi:uncharacterized protein YjlB
MNQPRVEAHLLKDDGAIPNNPKLPLLIYKEALKLPEKEAAALIERLLEDND